MNRLSSVIAALVTWTLPCSASVANPAPGATTAGVEAATTLSVDDAVALALRNSPTLRIAWHELNVARIDADRNRPAFRPDVTASASQVVRTPRVDLPGRADAVVLPNSISRFEVALRQPLWQFGAGSAPARRADAMEGAARYEYRKAALDAVLEMRQAYFSALQAEAMAAIARQGVDLARRHVQQTRLLVERGFQAEVDVLEAERALAEAETGALRADNGAALARANVNRLLGRAVDTPFRLVDPGDAPPPPQPLEALLERAREQRPEMDALRQQIRAAEAGIRLAKSSGQPRVDLEVVYALQTETALVPRSGLAAGVTLSAPLFGNATQRYTVKEAEERLEQLHAAVTALEHGIALEIEKERLALQEALSRIQASDRAAQAAEKAFEITQLRLERGRAVQLEVLNARLNLQKARADRAAARYDAHLAQARLERAYGAGPSVDELLAAIEPPSNETEASQPDPKR